MCVKSMVAIFFFQLNYARYYLPKIFPNLKERVVFIDDDCIVQGNASFGICMPCLILLLFIYCFLMIVGVNFYAAETRVKI